MPAAFPFGKILLRDLTAAKVGGQRALRVRETVEPFDETDARLPVRNPAVGRAP